MALYYAVFDKQKISQGGLSKEWESAKVGLEKGTAPGVTTGQLESARVIALEAASVAEAQAAIAHFFPGNVASPTVIVTEAQFKES